MCNIISRCLCILSPDVDENDGDVVVYIKHEPQRAVERLSSTGRESSIDKTERKLHNASWFP